MKFVWIPPGEFLMGGDPKDPETYDFMLPQHRVVITKGYYMGVHEVTAGQWNSLKKLYELTTEPDAPANISGPDETLAFLAQLNEKEKTQGYRLPTEAEWEYACRAGTKGNQYFDPTTEKIEDYEWFIGSNIPQERDLNVQGYMPVGTKKPNPWGIYDMLGNLQEVVSDLAYRDLKKNYYDHSPLKDPQGPKGDGVVDEGWSRRWSCAFRQREDWSWSGGQFGFRVVYQPEWALLGETP